MKVEKAGDSRLFYIWAQEVLSGGPDTDMMPAMTVILQLIDICLFRAGPEDLPATSRYLHLAMFAYLLTGVTLNQLDTDWKTSLVASVVDLAFLMAFIYLLFRQYEHIERWTQVMIALCGTTVFLGLLLFPIYQVEPTSGLNLVSLILALWALIVFANILRVSLPCSVPVSIVWTAVYIVLSLMLYVITVSVIL